MLKENAMARRCIRVLVAALLLAVGTEACAQTPAATSTNVSEYIVNAPSHSIRLARADWKAMPNDYEWAENFEEIRKGRRHEFPRVVTVFMLPMTADRRIGTRISPNEYVEMFVVHTGTLTVQVSLDKGSYWVLSRETFTAPSIRGVDTATLQHDLSDVEFRRASEAFQPERDPPRYLLSSKF